MAGAPSPRAAPARLSPVLVARPVCLALDALLGRAGCGCSLARAHERPGAAHQGARTFGPIALPRAADEGAAAACALGRLRLRAGAAVRGTARGRGRLG